jgi:hypothetical protein
MTTKPADQRNHRAVIGLPDHRAQHRAGHGGDCAIQRRGGAGAIPGRLHGEGGEVRAHHREQHQRQGQQREVEPERRLAGQGDAQMDEVQRHENATGRRGEMRRMPSRRTMRALTMLAPARPMATAPNATANHRLQPVELGQHLLEVAMKANSAPKISGRRDQIAQRDRMARRQPVIPPGRPERKRDAVSAAGFQAGAPSSTPPAPRHQEQDPENRLPGRQTAPAGRCPGARMGAIMKTVMAKDMISAMRRPETRSRTTATATRASPPPPRPAVRGR